MKTNLTNFFNYAAKEPQNTGGGNSQHEALIIAEQFSQRYALRSEGAQQRVSESETRGVNHAIITQLSRNNHPITLRAIRCAAVLLMVFMVGIGQMRGDAAYGFENNNTSQSGYPTSAGDGSREISSSIKRTGSYSLEQNNNNTSDKVARVQNLPATFKGGVHYIHSIAYLRKNTSNNVTLKGYSFYAGAEFSSQSVNIALSSDWTRVVNKGQKTGNSQNYTSVEIRYKTNTATKGDKVYIDDIVVYVTSSDVNTDLTAPNSPGSPAATTSSITWTRSTDLPASSDSTGVKGTLIWIRTRGSSDNLTLNNQGMYSHTSSKRGPSTDQSGDWTLVDSLGAATTSKAGTFSAGDRYAIVHYDLAYNYSEPVYTTITGGDPEPSCGEMAQAALELSANSGTICGTGTTTFTVSGGSGEGALSVSTSDDTKATATIDGTTVTVTGVAAGSATITVTKACDATYAEKSATFSATVAAIPTANAGADKTTEPGEGVTLAATAAAEGCTGAWTIQSGPNTSTDQLSSTSLATATFTPTAAGTYTLRWTVTNSTSSCSAYDEMTVTAATCAISSCGNATLTYPINVSEGTTTSNLVSGATPTGTGIAVVATSFAGIGVNDGSTKSVAKTNTCFPSSFTMSGKLEQNQSESYSSEKYLQFAFTVNSGYTFTPCDIQFVVQPVSATMNFRWEVTDGTNLYGYGTGSAGKGSDDGATVLTGLSSTETITGDGETSYYIRLYPYSNTDGNTFRIGKNVILKGTTAEVTPASGHAITKSASNGSIATSVSSTAVTSAESGDHVDIVATPNTGYQFSSWSIYETATPANTISPAAATASTSFTMPAAAVTVEASFSKIDYTVTHSAATNGSYTIKVADAEAVSENTTANYGQTVTLVATPASGYGFAGWTVMQGETPVSVTNNTFTMPAGNVTISASFEEIVCPAEGTVYSLSGWKTSNSSTWVTANNSSEQITGLGTLTGGAAYAVSIEASKVPQKDNDGKDDMAYKLGYNSVALRCALDCPLQEGDLITIVSSDSHSNAFILTKANSRDNAETTSCTSGTNTYTVKSNDKIVGSTDLYIWRNSSTLNIKTISIARPEKFDVTYHKNDGTDASTVAENVLVVAANEFTRSGYRFIEWNTQADGEGTTVAVGAAVTEDIELFAIWAQEYSVSYANTDAASGDAPTNANKYIAGETFKVAGVGSMVAADNYAFGGWSDGTATYQENADYTVGSANVSFTPVWNLHYTVTYKANGGTGSDIVVDNPAKVADCVFETPENKLFDKWNASAEGDGANYAVGADVSATLVLYAIWKDDECTTNRKSIFKAVLTGDATATVTGENGKEYAGDVLLNKLGGSASNRNTDATIAGVGSGLTTYKMNGTGAYMYGTLKKGAFQEGDKIQFAVSSTPGTLAIYGAKSSDLSQRVRIADMPAPNAAKVFTYTLTAANATALAGYDAIGIYRADGVTMNPFLYSLEITGCRVWTITHDVTFDMKDHGSAVAKQTLEVGAKVTEPAEPEAAGYIFGGWYKETTLENKWNFSTDVVPDNDITLYAKWTEDPCTDRQSLSKVVLTSESAGTVTGYNNDEYAGTEIIAGLSSSKSADLGDGSVTGYKLNNGGSAICMATLKKGDFQEGDKVTVGIVYQNDQRTVDDSKEIMTIYAGSDASHMMEVTTLTGVTGAGYYTYRLTAADAAAINEAGYKSIGLFRASSNGQNHYVYSVEITGCRDWAVSHTVTFNKMGKGADIASASVVEGDKVTKPTVVEPEGWALAGWYKEEGLVNEWDFDVDVMGEEDITLYAKWESEEGVIKLFSNTGVLNTTNFVSAAKKDGGIDIDEVNYPCLVEFGSNRSSLAGTTQADVVQYNATTNAAKIKLDLYNNASGAKTAYLWMVEEGATESGDPIEISIPGKTRLTTSYTSFNSEKPRSFYLTSGSKSDIKVLQVKVMDNGTAIPQFGKAGYSVNLNKGRVIAAANGTVPFDGATMHSNDAYTVLNSSNFKPKSYIQFTNAVVNTTVKITKASSNAYYVTNDLEHKGTSYTTDQEVVLTTTGTWYIGSVSSGSVAAFSKIEFIAPKCEAPAFNALANSDICSGDAYVALDGTGTVSDGGSITYKWYAEDDAETVLATTATYMPEADGSYYVVALHHVDGYTDNEVTSDVVTVTTHAGTAITEGLAHVRKTAGEAATLTVEATGKNLHYVWKECATIDGEYTAVDGATDSKSLDIVVPDGVKYYKVIVSSGCGADQESIAKVEKFIPVAQVVVSNSVVWDLTTCADAEIKLDKTTSPKKGDECLMANIEGVHMDENFHSESLVFAGEYIYRTSSATGHPTCAEYMKFETSVAGLVRVHFAGNGSNRCLRITSSDGVQYSSVSTGTGNDLTEQFEVAAGEIELMGMNSGHTSDKQYMRFYQIEFYALDQVRSDSWIAPHELGTVCYPNGHIVVGADMYQMAGVDENHKFAFDQVTVTEPGVPYLFEATGYDPIKFYKTTATAAEEAGTSNGMVGTFVAKTLTPAEGENLYYFQGTHFYSVADRTKNLSVPANRCYVDLNDPHPAMAPAPGRRRITFGVNGTNTATGVENIQTTEISIQKVLINGKMYILRGEKMYDATGRLVK